MKLNYKNFTTPITRRSLINGLSSSSLLFLLKPLERAFAQGVNESKYAKRFINFWIGNGVWPDYYYPDNSNNSFVKPLTRDLLSFDANGNEVPRQPGYALNPIENHGLLPKTIVVQGIQFSELAKLYQANPHEMGGIFTNSGGIYRNGKWTHPSIDQVILANQSNLESPVGSIMLKPDNSRNFNGERLTYSWKEGGVPVTPIVGGNNAYNSLFNGFSFDTQPGRPNPEVGRIQSQIDANLAQINRLRQRIGSQEKDIIDAHIAHLVEIEKKFSSDSAPLEICQDPSLTQQNNYFSQVVDHLSILLSAIQCGRVNVATVLLQSSGSWVTYGNEIGMNQRFQHHSMSHGKDPQSLDVFTRINRWAVDTVARFASSLDSVPEGSGTALDNSIVSMTYELGWGRRHNLFNIPHIIFGSGNQQYKTGQYIKFGDPEGNGGVPVNDLLLSHCRAMGIGPDKVEKVGLDSVASGNIISSLFQ